MPSSAFGLPVRSADRYEAPPAMTLLATLTASSSASLIYTGISWPSFKCYQIILSDVSPATTPGAVLSVQGSIDSGSNYASLWDGHILTNESTWVRTAFASSQTCTVQNATDNANASGVLFLQLGETVSSSTKTALYGRTTGWSGGGSAAPTTMLTTGFFSSTAPINTIRFTYSTGNIKSGSIRIYGIT